MTSARFAHVAENDTLPKLLRYNARRHGTDVALREKELGLWKSYTWSDIHERTKLWALALRSLGVGQGDTVAIIGDNRTRLDRGGHRRSRLARQEPRPLPGRARSGGRLPRRLRRGQGRRRRGRRAGRQDAARHGRHSLGAEDRLLRPARHAQIHRPRLVERDALLEAARKTAAAEPAMWDSLVDQTAGGDIAVLCSTSGTTSNPKLASLTSGRFIPHVATYCELLDLGPDDEYVSLLPMGWIGEQFQALYQPLVCRHKLNFVEEPDTVMTDLREIAPTFMFLAPRVWEQIAADVRAQIMDASRFKRWMFAWGVKRGLKAVERGRTSRLAQAMVLRALRDRLGFTRLRFASTGGAPMGPDTFKFFMAMGLPMLQLYGQTELGGIYCIQRRGEVDFDSVGSGFNDDYKIKIDKPDAQGVGEIVSQHPYMFEGYYKNEDATRAELREGWMYTGDAGYFKPSGQLVVIDRMRDLATTASGERFSPQMSRTNSSSRLTSAKPWCSATSAPASRRSCASASRSSPSGPSRTACRSPPIRTSQAVPRSTA